MELTEILEGFKTFYENRKDKLYLSDCLSEVELVQFQNLPNDLSAIPDPYKTIIINSNNDLMKKIELYELKIVAKIKAERIEKFLHLLNTSEKSEDLISLLNKIGTVKLTIDDGKISVMSNNTNNASNNTGTKTSNFVARLKENNYNHLDYKYFYLSYNANKIEFNIDSDNNIVRNDKKYLSLGNLLKQYCTDNNIELKSINAFSLVHAVDNNEFHTKLKLV